MSEPNSRARSQSLLTIKYATIYPRQSRSGLWSGMAPSARCSYLMYSCMTCRSRHVCLMVC